MSKCEFSLVFSRQYGEQHITTRAGDTITTVSRPDWLSFTQAVANLQGDSAVGSLLLSPELITATTDARSARGEPKPDVVLARHDQARKLSRRHPKTTMLLGTVTLNAPQRQGRPHNSLLFLRDGRELGRTHKSNIIAPHEKEVFQRAEIPAGIRKVAPHIMAVICSDFFSPPPIDAEVNTLLISACWGAPLKRGSGTATPDGRLSAFIERTVGKTFEDYPNMETIVMADRVPAGSRAQAPFNFVAQRI